LDNKVLDIIDAQCNYEDLPEKFTVKWLL